MRVHGVVAVSDCGSEACEMLRVLPRLWDGESGLDEWEGVTAFRGNLFHCRMSDSEYCTTNIMETHQVRSNAGCQGTRGTLSSNRSNQV